MIQNRTLPSNGPTRRALMGWAAIGLAVLLVPGALRAADPLKVVGIYTVPVEQQWVSRIHKAAEGAQKSGQIAYEFIENVSNTDYPGVLREYAESGANLILGEVFGIEQEAREVAADYPDVAFLFGSSLSADDALPNVSVFDNYIQDASYLSGIIAAAMSENDNISMVGGFPSPGVNRLMHAFMSGAREVTPDIKFQISFIGSWLIPPKPRKPRLP